jgi:hypothetical protein
MRANSSLVALSAISCAKLLATSQPGAGQSRREEEWSGALSPLNLKKRSADF